MKSILALLLASTTMASAVTVDILQDSETILDFEVHWGYPVSYHGSGSDLGNAGSTVDWIFHKNRNPNYYYLEIHSVLDAAIRGIGLTFWNDAEYNGPVPTIFGSPRFSFASPTPPQVLPIPGSPYGARFIYGTPELDGTWAMMLLGLAGIGLATFLDRKPKPQPPSR